MPFYSNFCVCLYSCLHISLQLFFVNVLHSSSNKNLLQFYTIPAILFYLECWTAKNFVKLRCRENISFSSYEQPVQFQFFDTIELTNLSNLWSDIVFMYLLLSKVHFTDSLRNSNTSQWFRLPNITNREFLQWIFCC